MIRTFRTFRFLVAACFSFYVGQGIANAEEPLLFESPRVAEAPPKKVDAVDGPQLDAETNDDPQPVTDGTQEVLTPSLVRMAGSAIEISIPRDWNVAEIPLGREVRVFISPNNIPARARRIDDGAWMTYHWRGRPLSEHELLEMLKLRLTLRTGGGAQLGQQSRMPIGEATAVVQEFDLKDKKGLHLIAGTANGVFELALTAPAAEYFARRESVASMLLGMKLTTPQPVQYQPAPQVSEALAAVGLWKGSRATMRFAEDGRIVVQFDRRVNFARDERGKADFDKRVTRLTGEYRAVGDLILVTWEDGSRLNYRWRVDDGQLLLTDHNGRVSQLNRILE